MVSPLKAASDTSSEREDISKLVDKLIGDDTPPHPAISPKHAKPDPSTSIQKTTPSTSAPSSQQRKLKLVVDQLAPVNIRPKEVEVYAKQTQTDVSSYEEAAGSEDEDTEVREEPSFKEVLGKPQENKEQEKQVCVVVV